MSPVGPILETKLYAPRPRQSVVGRSRLSERLQLGSQGKLTLISAPAGFGKSTLVAGWMALPADRWSTAWLSLDAGDNEAAAFWTYVIVALQKASPGIGEGARRLLASGQAPVETALTALLNELEAVQGDIALVLDDYHVIDAPEIQNGVAFLLDHLPPQVHVVIATRADPALPLARLRARGELVEIRAADLRFTPDEAAAYLNGAMGLALTAQDVSALDARTEGWIAALQLAALSMQGRDDVAGFIAGFAGDDRYIVDYLIEEVLQRQPEHVRNFLLQTSILGRLTGPLCDAVTGREGGKGMLEALDRGNLFLVPLDDNRRWYRYHHLFADVLRVRLMDERPGEVPDLHRRASDWYERNGERSEAVCHALEGEDFGRAADLIELAAPEMQKTRREMAMRGWCEALPRELFEVRPVLAIAYVGALMSSGVFAGIDELLQAAERWLGTPTGARQPGPPAAGMVVLDEAEFRRLPSAIAMYRAAQARINGDVAGTITHARQALDLAGEDDLARGAASGLLALASWTSGDLDAAQRWYADCIAGLEKVGHLSDVVGCLIAVADLHMAQGRLHLAMRTYERGLHVSNGGDGLVLRGAADMHTGMSELLCERNDLEAASEHLRTSRGLGVDNGLPQNPYRWLVAAARIRQAQGDLSGALELLQEAERVYVGDFSPDVRPVAAIRARVLIAQGNLAEAWGWAREHGVTASDELDYVREFEQATLARLTLAQAVRDRDGKGVGQATELTDRLLAAAEDGGRRGSALDSLVVQAIARDAADDPAGALDSLARAVALAEPEGYVRVIVDEGPPMAALLKRAARQSNASSFVRRLLTAAVTADAGAGVGQTLIEPLSERELEILRLLGSELDGPGIAHELTISLNTVRTHTRNVYAKLGENNRRAAVRRASELGLLTRHRDGRPTA